MHLVLTGFLATSGDVGCVVHALQALGENLNATQMTPLVHALEPIGAMQE